MRRSILQHTILLLLLVSTSQHALEPPNQRAGTGRAPRALRVLSAVAAAALAPPPAASPLNPAAEADGPLVCIVIRTYWGHGSYADNALPELLWALRQQTHQRWEALLVVMDNRPFPDLRHILRYNGDDRVQVFAEWISAQHQPRTADGKAWTPGYHTALYKLTDKAIRACPRATEWLVVTNGDNAYDPSFLARVVAEGEGSGSKVASTTTATAAAAGAAAAAGGEGGKGQGEEGGGSRGRVDAVAFDYYSRFQRPTGVPCERFASSPAAPPCKQNLMRWCHTDLAATAYRWPRFVGRTGEEGGTGLRFGDLDGGISHDGAMAEEVTRRGWKVAHVAGECLVEHAPSPQLCALKGGVWDDTAAASDVATGGRCLSTSRAVAVAAVEGVEEVLVNATHALGFGLPAGPLQMRCLRLRDPAAWALMGAYFSPACAAPLDAAADAAAGAAGAAAEAAAEVAAAA